MRDVSDVMCCCEAHALAVMLCVAAKHMHLQSMSLPVFSPGATLSEQLQLQHPCAFPLFHSFMHALRHLQTRRRKPRALPRRSRATCLTASPPSAKRSARASTRSSIRSAPGCGSVQSLSRYLLVGARARTQNVLGSLQCVVCRRRVHQGVCCDGGGLAASWYLKSRCSSCMSLCCVGME